MLRATLLRLEGHYSTWIKAKYGVKISTNEAEFVQY